MNRFLIFITKRETLLATASGCALAAAFPSVNVYLLGWVCLVPLLVASHGKTPRDGFVLGLVCGFVFHLGLIYWVVVSMSTYGGVPLAVSLLVLLAFCLVLSVFTAVPVWAGCYVHQRCGWYPFVTLPFFWTASEHVKSWLLTGFPWDNLGYCQYRLLPVIQCADITGVYGVSFALVAVNCCVAALFYVKHISRPSVPVVLLLPVVIPCALWWYGTSKLAAGGGSEGAEIRVGIVQPSIPQSIKWDPAYLDESMAAYSRLTERLVSKNVDLIVWPESATPFFFEAEPVYQHTVADGAEKTGAYILFGSPSWQDVSGEKRFYNSAYVLSPERVITDKYDKVHLVPYGEYVPFKSIFPFIHRLVAGVGDFSPGRAVKNLCIPQGCFAAPICYEIIFPDLVRRFVAKGADFIVNITNDAWFGRTSAPAQHLSAAVLRAVENRRYVVRCANTGISAVIDPAGRIRQRSGLFTQEVLLDTIVCRSDTSVYSLFGDVFPLGCCAASIAFLLAAYRKRRY